MQRLLTAAEYDSAEAQALATAANRIVECCIPILFLHESYPVRILSEKAAARYVDVMQDGRSEGTFSFLLGAVTEEEMALMRRVAAKVADFCERHYGIRRVPRSSMLRALDVVRHIRYLHPQPPATILEIGPGSAYVGALLMELGYRYIATDITQAFYIWQNHLMHAIAGDSVEELATEPRDFFADSGSSPAVHVPWWQFVVPAPNVRTQVDVVTCNHALCEMHPNALSYSLRVAHRMLAGAKKGCFIFEGWGNTVRFPIWRASQALTQAGFQFAFNDHKASVVVRGDSAAVAHAQRLPRDVPGKDVTDEQRYHPHIHVRGENPLGAEILAGRARTEASARFGIADVDRMLREVLGSDDLLTDDERFMNFVADVR